MQPNGNFAGTEQYIAGDDLMSVVNVAMALGRPLLVKGEPGTGKTLLAKAISEGLGMPLMTWHVKSTTKARDGLYVYDTVQRLYDSRFQDHDVSDIRAYIRYGPMGQAFLADKRVVLLIDEIDKADVEFPNDLLHELDAMNFTVTETGDHVAAKERPVVIITSNNEKELPDAFLRRVVFHFIRFPDREMMARIVRVHFPNLDEDLMSAALSAFYRLRDLDGLRKPPSTSELVDWVAALLAHGVDPSKLSVGDGEAPPFLGALLKREQDMEIAQRPARGRWR